MGIHTVSGAEIRDERCLRIAFEERADISPTLSRADMQEMRFDEVQLDLDRVAAVGSVEIGALIRFCIQAKSCEMRVVVTNVRPVVHEVFEITRFARLAEVRLAPAVVSRRFQVRKHAEA